MPRKKISDNVAEKLEEAGKEALEQMGIDPFQQLMNAGVEYEQNKEEDKPKRHRRTKAEIETDNKENNIVEDDDILTTDKDSHIIAIVEWDVDDESITIPSRVEIPDEILVGDYDIDTISNYLSDTVQYCHKGFSLKWPDHHIDQDEFCQWEIEKAHLKGYEEPDFDFRNFYEKGSTVYAVRYHDRLGTKELLTLYLRTIYPRMIVGVINKQYCECFGFAERDNIFFNQHDALNYFNSIQAKDGNEYNEETGKKKRKRKKVEDEDDIEQYIHVENDEEDEE